MMAESHEVMNENVIIESSHTCISITNYCTGRKRRLPAAGAAGPDGARCPVLGDVRRVSADIRKAQLPELADDRPSSAVSLYCVQGDTLHRLDAEHRTPRVREGGPHERETESEREGGRGAAGSRVSPAGHTRHATR